MQCVARLLSQGVFLSVCHNPVLYQCIVKIFSPPDKTSIIQVVYEPNHVPKFRGVHP